MFKKLLVTTAILAVSSSVAFAASYKGERDYKGEMAAPCPVNTFGVGPYVGLSVGDRTNYSGTPVTFKGIDGNLSLGYSGLFNSSFYLAGEVFGIATANVKDFTNVIYRPQQTVSAKSSWGYGASILPGYMLTDTVLGYLRAGAIRTRFNGDNANVNETGWQVGLGGEAQLMPYLDVRGEYIYTSYGTVASIGKTSSDQANLGLVYKFL